MTTQKKAPPKVAPATEPKPDPRLCRCEGVQRRYDGDGLLEYGQPNLYRCAKCGKGYS